MSNRHQTDDFEYPRGTISSDVSSDKDIDRRVRLAAGIVRSLHSICISKGVKTMFY